MKKLLALIGIFATLVAGAIDDLGMTAEIFRDGKKFEYREIDGAHSIWSPAYRAPQNIDWLFRQRKTAK